MLTVTVSDFAHKLTKNLTNNLILKKRRTLDNKCCMPTVISHFNLTTVTCICIQFANKMVKHYYYYIIIGLHSHGPDLLHLLNFSLYATLCHLTINSSY